ncbi:hypothetical protein FDF86_11270 [Clostridium botulinum]|nr:hypothetical protein [Clostridium botulinum]
MNFLIFILFILLFIVLLNVIIKKYSKATKIEDADIPGQLNAIINKLNLNSTYYQTIPAISKQSTSDMIKDSLKSKLVSNLTGHYFFTYVPNENFVLIFGENKMFFVPIITELKTKKLIPDFEKVSEISCDDIISIKNNSSHSTITLKLNDNSKFLFGPIEKYFFDGAKVTIEKDNFIKFIDEFSNVVNKSAI